MEQQPDEETTRHIPGNAIYLAGSVRRKGRTSSYLYNPLATIRLVTSRGADITDNVVNALKTVSQKSFNHIGLVGLATKTGEYLEFLSPIISALNAIRDRLDPPTIKLFRIQKNVGGDGAHGANDVINDVGASQWIIKNAAAQKGGSGYITQLGINTEVESQTARIAVQVFTKAVTSTLVDDAPCVSPNTNDEPYMEGEITPPALTSRGDGSYTLATPSTVGGLPLGFTCLPSSRDLYLNVIAVDITSFDAGERMIVSGKIERMKTVR